MSLPDDHAPPDVGELDAAWTAEIDISRTPSPGVPPKRMRMTLEDIAQDMREIPDTASDSRFHNLLRIDQGPESLGYSTSAQSFKELWFTQDDSSRFTVRNVPASELNLAELTAIDVKMRTHKKEMQTGCIPCL